MFDINNSVLLLVNITSGGQGPYGLTHTEITKNLISQKNRKNFQDIKQEFERRDYILLTEEKDYKNAIITTKLKYICPKGHESSIRWHEFQQGQDCKKCKDKFNSEKRRKNYQEIKKEFERRDYILLTEEKDYENAFTKLKYICPEGHESSIRWNDFQQGHGCSIEGTKLQSKNQIGEAGNNHKLIEEDIIEIKTLLIESNFTLTQISIIFGVCIQTISNIKYEKSWSHIKI